MRQTRRGRFQEPVVAAAAKARSRPGRAADVVAERAEAQVSTADDAWFTETAYLRAPV
ncbi:MAG: hypothetical protein L7V86_19665 [Verrucomicrobiales bacterium]|nr:hypothetical protein [Verrucomicrobiales bacterium]